MKTHDFVLVNCDTDSIMVAKPDGSPFSEEEQEVLLEEMNTHFEDLIIWENDGYYDSVVVVKSKNYCLLPHGEDRIKKKGSSIKDSKKEPAMLEMLDECIKDMIHGTGENIPDIYNRYILEAADIQDIDRWSVKKTVTEAVLNPTRAQEQKILDAIQGKHVQEGDKVYLYSAIDGEKQKVVKGEPVFLKNGTAKMVPNEVLKLAEKWNGDYNVKHYMKRVYNTLKILEKVLDFSTYTKYYNSNYEQLLEELRNE